MRYQEQVRDRLFPARKKLRARYLALHDLSFFDKGINKGINPLFIPLFIGIPGTDQTFLARALAYRARNVRARRDRRDQQAHLELRRRQV